jgi:hypothetical protein
MPSAEDIAHQQELLNINRRTVYESLKQYRKLGGSPHATIGVVNTLREARVEIARIKEILRSWDITVEDYPDDRETVPDPSAKIRHEQGVVVEDPDEETFPDSPRIIIRQGPWSKSTAVGRARDMHINDLSLGTILIIVVLVVVLLLIIGYLGRPLLLP